MIIKKFTAKTEEEAIALAKAELGENIVIMNVKTVSGKGFFGFFKKPKVEVTVAKEDGERYAQAASERRTSEEASLRDTFRQVAKAAGTDKEESTFSGNNNGSASPLGRSFDKRLEDIVNISREEDSGENHRLLVKKLDSLQSMIERKFQEEEEEDIPEIPPEEEENSEMVRFVKLLYNTMLENEVSEQYANQIIDEIEKNAKANLPFDHALADVYQKLILKFGKAAPIEKKSTTPHVVFFIGPTGVGKTTTIAKLASKFKLEEKRKIALLTADTYRIAAAEQLRIYANILEVPFRVIYTVEDLQKGVQDFKKYDLILVDMAGHSPQNPALREGMYAFIAGLNEGIEKEVHLVVSATTKYKDLLNIVDSYADLGEFKIIFTKLDETEKLGNLLNVKLHTGVSLSYVAYGQNVPDDIEIFNPQKTVKQLLGGKK